MKVIEGKLEAYWEQGMEGRIDFAFNFEGNHQPFFLKNGQHLTIYDSDNTVLWSGKIQFVKRGFFDNHKLNSGIWSYTKQKGVSYADWMDWFWRKPALKAKLEIEEYMSDKKDSPAINKYVHPPIVAMFFIIVAILFGRFVPLISELSTLIRNIGFGFVVVGFLFGLAAFIEFRKAKTTILPHGSASNIIASGIFRFTRNPIYLGFLFMVIGFPLNYGSVWGVLIAPLFIATMNRLVIEKEEAYLEKKFGKQYTNFKSSVRRWL